MTDMISDMNAVNKNFDKEKYVPYKTLPRRIFAGMIDTSIYTMISMIILITNLFFHSPYIYVILWSIMIPLICIYVISTTKFLGGTLGKLYFNIAVLKNTSEENITWKQSILRELINIGINLQFLAVPYVFIAINKKFDYNEYLAFTKQNTICNIIDILFFFVIIIEIITAAGNKKRRSVHDFIGGTIVKTTGKYRRFSNFIALISVVIIYSAYLRLLDYII